MHLYVVREPKDGDRTPGVLFVNGRFFGYTLEDIEREVPGAPVASWKIPSQTAIPVGDYQVHLALSPRLGRKVPWLLDVPGFSAIQIHPLNTVKETEGCIGVGYTRTPTGIGRSREACDALTAVLASAGGKGMISVASPFRRASQ